MIIIHGDTFADCYNEVLHELLYNPSHVSNPRGTTCKEIINLGFVMKDAKSNVYLNNVRSSQFKYIAAELLWYMSGRNDLKFIEQYAKFWRFVANDDETLNSAYGNLIFNQPNIYDLTEYQWALKSLIDDKDTRQAIMHFNKPMHQRPGVKDFVCTMYAHFVIRDGKLDMSVFMRSNDAILGTATDVAFFTTLQSQLCLHLQKYYEELEVGSYTHLGNSFHIYDRHFDLVERMLKTAFIPDYLPELTIDLIDSKGKSTEALLAMVKSCETKSDFDIKLIDNDPLCKYIINELIKQNVN